MSLIYSERQSTTEHINPDLYRYRSLVFSANRLTPIIPASTKPTNIKRIFCRALTFFSLKIIISFPTWSDSHHAQSREDREKQRE